MYGRVELPEHIATLADPGERWRAICAEGRAKREKAVAARDRYLRAAAVPVFGPAYQERTVSGLDGDECLVCGRHTSADLFVRMSADMTEPIEWADPREVDGGCFPIGADCAKRFPDEYVGRLDQQEGTR